MKDYRLEILRQFEKELNNDEFINKSKDGNQRSFTRSRVFTFKKLVVLLMILKTSYQREINSFCKKLIRGNYNIREATSGALTQARAKLNPYAFQRLNEIAVTTFYKDADFKKWKGFRLLAVDGSVLNLPFSESVVEEFGCEDYINKSNGKKSMARCSLLYDVLNHVSIDAQISGYRTSEKSLMKNHLAKLRQGDLVLGDRGYAYSSIIYWLSQRDVDFCIRFHDHKMKAVKNFTLSDKMDIEIEMNIDERVLKTMKLPKDTPPIKLRLVKVKLDNGAIEVLGTSLLDTSKFATKVFKELYHFRWGVEEAFKMLKSRIGLEDFTGRTARSILQDFHSKTLMMTLCATLSHPIEQKVRKEYSAAKKGNKYDQKINRTDAMAETRNNLIALLIDLKHQRAIQIMDKIIEASRTIIRPNRKCERLKTVNKRKALNYKPI